MNERRDLSEQLSQSNSEVTRLQTDAAEQIKKYNKVKKAYYDMKDRAKTEYHDNNENSTKILELEGQLERLKKDHKELQESSATKIKLYKRKSENVTLKYEKVKRDVEKKQEELDD